MYIICKLLVFSCMDYSILFGDLNVYYSLNVYFCTIFLCMIMFANAEVSFT